MDTKRLHVEIQTPKQNPKPHEPAIEAALPIFERKIKYCLDKDLAISITDNPMGELSFTATEVLVALEMTAAKDGDARIAVHLNTFHTKESLDQILTESAELGVKHILVVSGDGSERLPKLKPEAIGRYGLNPNKSAVNTVTSVELLRYIHGEYPGTFTLGVAFNPYENREHELEKMRRKMDAGASYIITQPIVLSPPYGSRKWAGEVLASMSALRQLPGADKMGLMIEAWMMKELKLIPSCVGFALEGIPNAEDIKRANLDPAQHDAIETLKDIYQRFGMATEYKAGIYLAALGEKPEFFLPKVDKAIAALQAQNGILQ